MEHLKKIRPLANEKHRELRRKRLEKISSRVNKEIESYKLDDININRSLLAMLYWAEGAKNRGNVTFANTDPKLSLLFITLLRKSYQLDESKFRLRLHLHYYHSIKKQKKFWSGLLDIPISKIGKVHIKKRGNSGKRYRKNFYDISFIIYYSEDLRYEILETARCLADKYVSVA